MPHRSSTQPGRRVHSGAIVALALTLAVSTAAQWPGGSGEAVEPSGSASTLIGIGPARLLDTRPGEPTVDGRFAGIAALPAGSTLQLAVGGRGGIRRDAVSVMLNLAAFGAPAPGRITVHHCADDAPLASSLNFRPGEVANNAVLAPVSPVGDGAVCISATAETHLTVDVTAYGPNANPAGTPSDDGSPRPIGPARLLDTRLRSSTVDGAGASVGRQAAGATLELQVAGRAGIPADAEAVMANVSVVAPATRGFVTIHRCDRSRPIAAHLNHRATLVTGNAGLVPLDRDGRACIFTSAETDLTLDVSAYVPAGGSPRPVGPARILDTRPGQSTIDGLQQGDGRRVGESTLVLQVAGRGGVPVDAVLAMVNVTAVDPGATGYITLHPCSSSRPRVSHLNYSPGAPTGNAVVAKLDRQGRVCLSTRSDTDVVVDVTGYASSLASSDERAALAAIYHATDGPNWLRRQGWIIDADPCTWSGVTCDPDGIWALGLAGNRLAGPLPPELGDLQHLARLFLRDNGVTAIPGEIGRLSKLRRLALDGNALSGLPDGIGELRSVQSMEFQNNQIAAVPPGLGELSNVDRLDLSDNAIASLPEEIGGISDVAILDLQNNALASIPAELGQAEGLLTLDLGRNQLTSLPSELGDLTGLVSLDVGGNQLTSLPPEIGQLTTLSFLEAANNQLTELPDQLAALTSLSSLGLGRNRLTSIEPEITNLGSLVDLRLHGNVLNGDLTAALAAIRDSSPILSMSLAGDGCPTITDVDVLAWVEQFDTNWDAGCG